MPADPWPTGVPSCLTLDSFASGVGNGLIRSSMDTGPAKVRRRSTAAVRPLRGQVPMTYAQLATLEEFIEETLLGGSLPFTFPSQRGGADVLARFAASDGDVLPWRKLGIGRVMVELNLELLPPFTSAVVVVSDGDDTATLDFTDPDQTINAPFL